MGTATGAARARALAALDRHDNAEWSAPPDDEAWELLRAVLAERTAEVPSDYVDIVFDGPPEHTAGRFVEVEDSTGRSIRFGQWVKRPDRMWVLRIPREERATEYGVRNPRGSVGVLPNADRNSIAELAEILRSETRGEPSTVVERDVSAWRDSDV